MFMYKNQLVKFLKTSPSAYKSTLFTLHTTWKPWEVRGDTLQAQPSHACAQYSHLRCKDKASRPRITSLPCRTSCNEHTAL